MVTIQEVAKEAQVSVGSVSRYLNGHKLKEQNMQKIKQAIETLDYKENLFAKGLKSNQTLSIGILMNNMQSVFSSTLIAQIEEEMESHNYSILLNSYRNKIDKVAAKIDFLLDRKVDGLIIFEGEPEWPVYERLQTIEIPVISVNTTLDYPHVDSIIVNNRQSAKNMISKIIDSGHDHMGVISVPQKSSVARDRLNGTFDAFSEKGLDDSDYQIFYGDYSQKSGYQGAKTLIDQGLTTIFVTNYNMALGSLQYMFEKGLKLGEDISFACFDYPGVSDIFYPRLTTVRQPVHKMGTVTVNRMFERIKNPTIKNEIIQLENEIHWGNSIKEWK
ncbi:LacI family DNA-binding transcriptional regulator [Enterococcus sp. DIV0876]|uniref:LacI family DNA-binding transcriptional regulator n=1 Tax=Enterococcus sp. DIV0876 TaxID=2774633 RepID=UPI003D2FFC27